VSVAHDGFISQPLDDETNLQKKERVIAPLRRSYLVSETVAFYHTPMIFFVN